MLNQSDLTLFGYDLSAVWAQLKLGCQQLLWGDEAGLRARYAPPLILWEGPEFETSKSDAGGTVDNPENAAEVHHGLLVPDAECLVKCFTHPAALEPFLEQWALTEITTSSPFPAHETDFGWIVTARDSDFISVDLAMTSKATVAQLASAFQRSGKAGADQMEPLIYLSRAGDRPIAAVQQGVNHYQKRYYSILGLRAAALSSLFVAASLVLWLAASLTGLRSDQYQELLTTVKQESASATDLRAQFLSQSERLEALDGHLRSRLHYGNWLHTLALYAPDSVHFSRLSFAGREANMSGMAVNAADYLSRLADAELFDSLEANTQFTRDDQTGLERFSLSMTLPEAGS